MTRSIPRFAVLVLGLMILTGAFAASWDSIGAVHDGHDQPSTSEASPAASPAHGTGTGTGAVYLTISNGGTEPDRLLGGVADVARIIEIHDMAIEGGVMRMTPLVDGLEIPAGDSVSLEPQGYHVMLIDLTRDLRPGDRFDLTLRFERAGEVVVPVTVGGGAPEGEPAVGGGDIAVTGAWSRPAPMLSAVDAGTPAATPPQ